jgi:hypothetical protein
MKSACQNSGPFLNDIACTWEGERKYGSFGDVHYILEEARINGFQIYRRTGSLSQHHS